MLKQGKHHVTAAVDSSFADCEFTARSTSGFVVWFGGSPVVWECKRQPLVTLSTMESEYVAASRCVSEIRFINKLTDWVGLDRQVRNVHEDNAACIAISANPVHKQRSKHIAVKYHNVRDACKGGNPEVNDGRPEIALSQVWTEHQVADIFTKSLSRGTFERFRSCLIGSPRNPMVHFDEMMENHQRKESAVIQNISSKSCCSCCQIITDTPGYVKNHRMNGGHCWPKYVVPFREDCPIKCGMVDGWFDTRDMGFVI